MLNTKSDQSLLSPDVCFIKQQATSPGTVCACHDHRPGHSEDAIDGYGSDPAVAEHCGSPEKGPKECPKFEGPHDCGLYQCAMQVKVMIDAN